MQMLIHSSVHSLNIFCSNTAHDKDTAGDSRSMENDAEENPTRQRRSSQDLDSLDGNVRGLPAASGIRRWMALARGGFGS